MPFTLSDGFDDGDISEYTGDTASAQVQTSNLEIEGNTVEISFSGGNNKFIRRDFASTQTPESVSFEAAAVASTSDQRSEFNLLGGNGQSLINVTVQSSFARVAFFNGSVTQLTDYTPGEVVRVELDEIDYANNQIGEILVDGDVQATNVSFNNSGSVVQGYNIGTAGGGAGQAYFDNISFPAAPPFELNESFEDGFPDNFNVRTGISKGVVTDQAFDGSQSFHVDGVESPMSDPLAVYSPPELSGGVTELDEFEFYYYENSESFGHGIKLISSNGEHVIGAYTNNPQWTFVKDTENQGKTFEIFGGNSNNKYGHWVKVRLFNFDFDAREVQYEWDDPVTGDSRSGEIGLGDDGDDIEKIGFVAAYSGTGKNGGYEQIEVDGFWDDITIRKDNSPVSSTRNFDLARQVTQPSGLEFSNDGTKFFVLGGQNAKIFEYSMTEPFDITTASFTGKSFSASQDNSHDGMTFGNGGTKLYTAGNSSNAIHSYTLTTAFDISTATFIESFDVSGQDTQPLGVDINENGSKIFLNGGDTDSLYSYNLSDPFNISSASLNTSTDISTTTSVASGMHFTTDGTEMYLVHTTSERVDEYKLSTAFDLSTLTFEKSYNVVNQNQQPRAVHFVDGNLVDTPGSVTIDRLFLCGGLSSVVNSQSDSPALHEFNLPRSNIAPSLSEEDGDVREFRQPKDDGASIEVSSDSNNGDFAVAVNHDGTGAGETYALDLRNSGNQPFSVTHPPGLEFFIKPTDVGNVQLASFYEHNGPRGSGGERKGFGDWGRDNQNTSDGFTLTADGQYHSIRYEFDWANDQKEFYVDGVKEQTAPINSTVETFNAIAFHIDNDDSNSRQFLADNPRAGKVFSKALSEVVAASDSLQRSIRTALSQVVAVSDSFSLVFSRQLAESPSVSDNVDPFTNIGQVGSDGVFGTGQFDEATFNNVSRGESPSVADSIRDIFVGLRRVQPLNVEDADVFNLSKPLQVFLAVQDSEATSVSRALDEVASVSDRVEKSLRRGLQESSSVVDSESFRLRRRRQESVSLADSVDTVAELFRRFVETQGVSDSVRLELSRGLAEAVDAGDNVATDTELFRSLSEQTSLVDERRVRVSRELQEALGLSDSVVRRAELFRSFSESVGVVDEERVRTIKSLSEAVAPQDRVQRVLRLVFVASVIVNDADIFDLSKPLVEAVQTVDNRREFVGAVRQQGVSVNDVLFASSFLELSESVSVVDTFDRVAESFRAFSESFALDDSFVFDTSTVLRLTQSIDVQDSFSSEASLSRSFSESPLVNDAVRLRLAAAELRESLSVEDKFSALTSLAFREILSAQDKLRRKVFKRLSEDAVVGDDLRLSVLRRRDESLSPEDDAVVRTSLLFRESVDLEDSDVFNAGLVFEEVVGVGDGFRLALRRSLGEGVPVAADLLTERTAFVELEESISASDRVLRLIEKQLGESLSVVDALRFLEVARAFPDDSEIFNLRVALADFKAVRVAKAVLESEEVVESDLTAE